MTTRFRFIIISMALSLVCNICNAQTDEERALKGKEIVDKSSAKTKSYANISAKFALTIENKQARSIENYNGTMATKGEKYHLSLMNTETYFDGQAVYAWSKDNNEVTIYSPDDSGNNLMNPQQILGNFDGAYKFLFIDEVAVDNRQCNEVDLYPIDRHSNVSRIRLFVDKQTNNVKSIIQQNKDGNVYTINISTMDTKTPIADSQFTFDKAANPGVEIVDMR